MLAKVFSGGVFAVNAFPVEIEVDASYGEPNIHVVGLPDVAVRESTFRVSSALINSGFAPPIGRTTVNLAPADIRKEGPSFDLPIALGMLAAMGDLKNDLLPRVCIVGELALSGEVRKVRGVLPIAIQAKESGLQAIIVPEENAPEAGVVQGLKVFAVRNLREAVDFLNLDYKIAPFELNLDSIFADNSKYPFDYEDVKGQQFAKRALEVSVSGGHNILMIGPPGSGKSMLAKRIPTILPPMTMDEALETTKIHSIAGTLKSRQALVATRPFRAPHHTISNAGLLGGGTNPAPGEVSLSHNGVLFLDELPEFQRSVLEVMRQPLEDGYVTIARAASTATFPSRFMLVASMNPCPCGYNTDPKRECRCTQLQVQRYRNRISGPLLDRIDIHIEVPAIDYSQLTSKKRGESSASIRERVIKTRNIQSERFKDIPHIHCNADMGAREVQKFCNPNPEAIQMLRMAVEELNFSARAYDRILKVSRTIADLAGTNEIYAEHVQEAIQYRTLDRNFWV